MKPRSTSGVESILIGILQPTEPNRRRLRINDKNCLTELSGSLASGGMA